MYTKVYGCVCWWSSYASVYFFIRCWLMWLYIIWYGYAQRLSIYSLSVLVHLFIVSSQNMSALGVDFYARECYIIYITGVIWNDSRESSHRLCCQDLASYSMVGLDGRLCLSHAPACLDRALTSCQPFTFYSLTTKENCLCIQLRIKSSTDCARHCGQLCLYYCLLFSDTTYSVCLCKWLANP